MHFEASTNFATPSTMPRMRPSGHAERHDPLPMQISGSMTGWSDAGTSSFWRTASASLLRARRSSRRRTMWCARVTPRPRTAMTANSCDDRSCSARCEKDEYIGGYRPLLARGLVLFEHEFREDMTDVQEAGIEELERGSRAIAVERDAVARDGLRVVTGEAIVEGHRPLGERLHRRAGETIFARQDGELRVRAVREDVGGELAEGNAGDGDELVTTTF